MALSLANVASPDLKLPYEAVNLFSAGPTYAVLTAFAALFLILTVIWYRKVPAASSQTAEWFLTAGRNMKSGIVAASIACTWTWAATLMVSSAKGYQHGIAGPYWYAAGATIPLLLFAILAIYLKHRAPMAHTFGEFVRHRFGGPSHRLMLCLGLLSCVIVTAMVVLGGAYALRALTGLDVRLAVLLIPLAFAFYSALGGLRGSIVVEYAQMVVLLVIALVLTIWFWSGHGDLGIFERLRALPAREGEAYLTMASLAALLFGIVNTIGNLGTVFMDQTYWQRAIAAAPHSAGRSFLIGGLAWFAIPFGVATALGVGGLALGLAVPFPYTDIAPTTAAVVFGPLGAWLFLIMLFMAIISTGNAESIAVASLVATDIYKTYLRPQASDGDILRIARRATLAFALLIGPVCLALHTLAIDMEWLYLTMGIFVGAGAIPLALGLLTDRLTGRGAYWATLGGLVIGLTGWITAAHELEGAITLDTLGRLGPITIGNLSVILTSALICWIDCARPHARFRFELLRDAIRSYLAPPIGADVARTPPDSPTRLSGRERRLIGWGIGLAVLLELIVPGGLYLSGIQFGQELFAVWVILSLVWLLMAAGFIVLLPIKDHYETEYPEWLDPKLVQEDVGRTAIPVSIGNRLFLSFLTVVLTLGIGAVVSLVKLGSIEHLRGTNERIITEEDLHGDMVSSLIPQVLEELSRGERGGLAAATLSERVQLFAASPHTPSLLRAMVSSSDQQDPIPYLSLGEKERAFLAGSIAGTYRGTRLANVSQIGQQRRQAIALILISLVGTLTIGLFLTIRTSAAITRPVRRLAEAAGRFAAGEPPAPPLPVETTDEIGVLTEEFNAMAARIREQVTALKAAEEEFRLIVSHVNDAIIYLDVEGSIRWGNDQACVLLGRPSEKLLGLPIVSVLTPESAMLAEARLAAVRHGASVSPLVELSIVHPDSEVILVEANAASVHKNGKIVGRLLVFRDVTERKQAENALRESVTRHRAILESAMDAVITITQDGRIVEFNPAAEAMFGYTRGAVIGKEMVERIIPPSLRENHRMDIARYLATGQTSIIGKRIEMTAMHADGAEFPVELTVTRIVLAGQTLFTAFIRDITARKRAEGELHSALDRLRAVIDNSPIAILSLDAQGRVTGWNHAAEHVFGWTEEEVLGRELPYLAPGQEQESETIWERVMRGGELGGLELRRLRKDGSPVDIAVWATRLFDQHGTVIGSTGLQVDITERKRAEEALRESQERFSSAFGDAAIGMALVGTDGRWLQVNRSLCEIVGYTEQELLATTFQAITHPDDLAADLAYVRQVLEGVIQTYQMEKRYFHKQGHIVWILLSVSLVRDPQENPLYFIGQIQDITERKRAEDAIHALVVGTASVTGEEFFPVFVRQLAGAVGTRYAFVTELVGDEQARVRVLAIWMGDRLGAPFEYDLIHTPCKVVFNQGRAYHPESVQEIYPKDKDLVGLRAVGYLGVTMAGSSGKPIGHICVLDDKPLREESAITSIMNVFAARAAAELERKHAEEALRESEQRLSQLLEDRERISRDLHDNIIQTLYAIGLGIEECRRLTEEDPKTTGNLLGHAISDLNAVIRDVRSYIAGTEPKITSGQQLRAIITRLARTMEGTRLLHFRLKVDQDAADRLTSEEANHVLYIVREAMSNSLRHSHAKTGAVSLRLLKRNVRLEVADDGAGFDMHKKVEHGTGLHNMMARAKEIGARFEVVSQRGQGTRVILNIPLVRENA